MYFTQAKVFWELKSEQNGNGDDGGYREHLTIYLLLITVKNRKQATEKIK